MKRKGHKLAIISLALILVGDSFAGCSKYENKENTSSIAVSEENKATVEKLGFFSGLDMKVE